MAAIASAGDTRLGAGRLYGDADGSPDIFGIMLGVIFLRPVHRDRIIGARQLLAMPIENAGAGAAGSNIDGNNQIAH